VPERLTTANTVIIIIIIITSSSSQSASGIGSGEHHSAKDQSSTVIAGAGLFANLTSPLYRFRIDYRTRTEAKPSQCIKSKHRNKWLFLNVLYATVQILF